MVAGVEEVVQRGLASAGDLDERFDAAVVSDALPERALCDVVITLPDTCGGAGIGTMAAAGAVHDVTITRPEDLIDLLTARR